MLLVHCPTFAIYFLHSLGEFSPLHYLGVDFAAAGWLHLTWRWGVGEIRWWLLSLLFM